MFLDHQDVRRAFEGDEFFPLFQPLVELSSGRLAGFEALARWNHARLGAISPDAFIPIVQKCGYINALTRKLLEKTFAAAPLLPDGLRLSINLSPLQVMDETLPGQIAAVAQSGGFPLDRLTVEMTEGALLNHFSCAEAVAGELKAMQCRLSLDDFGAGHSSLIHLHALPFDEVKIDRSLIHAMTQCRASWTIVAAVFGLARDLGLETVAEGVETEEEAGILSEMHCDMAQGWLFGKPAAAIEIPRMVSAALCNQAGSIFVLEEQEEMVASV
ncbi:MAG: EAL domain-containing protein [Terracidiphilus sp.]|jgi:EAL domain-containing protein (putative c-di-GMP-specific phosphodiesterase class I)